MTIAAVGVIVRSCVLIIRQRKRHEIIYISLLSTQKKISCTMYIVEVFPSLFIEDLDLDFVIFQYAKRSDFRFIIIMQWDRVQS